LAIVINSGKAKSEECKCYLINPEGANVPENRICWVEGAVGALSDPQEKEFCLEAPKKQELPSKLARRFGKFKKMGKVMDVCAESEAKDFYSCVIREAKKLKGAEV